MTFKTFLRAVFVDKPKDVRNDTTHKLVQSALLANDIASNALTQAVTSLMDENIRLRRDAEPCDIPGCHKRRRTPAHR